MRTPNWLVPSTLALLVAIAIGACSSAASSGPAASSSSGSSSSSAAAPATSSAPATSPASSGASSINGIAIPSAMDCHVVDPSNFRAILGVPVTHIDYTPESAQQVSSCNLYGGVKNNGGYPVKAIIEYAAPSAVTTTLNHAITSSMTPLPGTNVYSTTPDGLSYFGVNSKGASVAIAVGYNTNANVVVGNKALAISLVEAFTKS